MDKICIDGIKFETIIGIHPAERQHCQALLLDIEIGIDAVKAASRDSLHDTVDYDALSKRVLTFVNQAHYQLIETLAEKIADMLLYEFKLPYLKLRLTKPEALKKADSVSVVIERE